MTELAKTAQRAAVEELSAIRVVPRVAAEQSSLTNENQLNSAAPDPKHSQNHAQTKVPRLLEPRTLPMQIAQGANLVAAFRDPNDLTNGHLQEVHKSGSYLGHLANFSQNPSALLTLTQGNLQGGDNFGLFRTPNGQFFSAALSSYDGCYGTNHNRSFLETIVNAGSRFLGHQYYGGFNGSPTSGDWLRQERENRTGDFLGGILNNRGQSNTAGHRDVVESWNQGMQQQCPQIGGFSTNNLLGRHNVDNDVVNRWLEGEQQGRPLGRILNYGNTSDVQSDWNQQEAGNNRPRRNRR